METFFIIMVCLGFILYQFRSVKKCNKKVEQAKAKGYNPLDKFL